MNFLSSATIFDTSRSLCTIGGGLLGGDEPDPAGELGFQSKLLHRGDIRVSLQPLIALYGKRPYFLALHQGKRGPRIHRAKSICFPTRAASAGPPPV